MDPRPPQAPTAKTEEKRELTPLEKETVKSFEDIPFKGRIRSRNEFILTWLKYKDATEIYFDPDISEGDLQKAKEIIEKAGLFFVDKGIIQYKTNLMNEPRRICFVGNTSQDRDLFSELWFGDHENDPRVYNGLGRMSGFPKTAIEAVNKVNEAEPAEREKVREQLILSPAEKRNLFPPELYHFAVTFYMSREHWKEELETVRKWAEGVKMVDPKLYRAFLDIGKPKK